MHHSWPIIQLQRVDSSNNYASLLLSNNEVNTETVVSAQCQEKGRGQQGNYWESKLDKNLAFSLILYTDYLNVEKQFSLSQAIALSIIDLLNDYKIIANVKWPNDILVENKKIAGILVENSIMGHSIVNSIVGIGLNVNQVVFGNFEPKAVSLKMIKNEYYDIQTILNQLLDKVWIRLEQLKKKEFFILKEQYLQNLYGYEKIGKYCADGKEFSGTIKDVRPTGELVILAEDNTELYFMFKEVKFII